MGDLVNLRRARKRKARQEAEAGAVENRLRFGRPGVEQKLDEARKELDARRLDAHKRSE